MKAIIFTFVLTMLVSMPSHADEGAVKSALRLICSSGTPYDPNLQDSVRAQKIFDLMKMSEKKSCGLRGDDFLQYLMDKYSERVSS
ncbi:MAG: hypothetical protein WBW72_02465 [Erwinia billingiae]